MVSGEAASTSITMAMIESLEQTKHPMHSQNKDYVNKMYISH